MKYKKKELNQVKIVYTNGDVEVYEDILFATGHLVLKLRSVYGDIHKIIADNIRSVSYYKYHSDEIIRV